MTIPVPVIQEQEPAKAPHTSREPPNPVKYIGAKIKKERHDRRTLLTPFPLNLLHREERAKLRKEYPLTHAVGHKKDWHRFSRNLTRRLLAILSEEHPYEGQHSLLGLQQPMSTEEFKTLINNLETLVQHHGKNVEFPMQEHHLNTPCKSNSYDDGGVYVISAELPNLHVPLFVKKWDRKKEFDRTVQKQATLSKHHPAIPPFLSIDEDSLITVEPFINGIPFSLALAFQNGKYEGKRQLILGTLEALHDITEGITRMYRERIITNRDPECYTITEALAGTGIPTVIDYDRFFITKFLLQQGHKDPSVSAPQVQQSLDELITAHDLPQDLIEEYRKMVTSRFEGQPAFLNHGDLNQGNIIITQDPTTPSTGSARFIDWEGAFIGNVLYDIVKLLKKVPLAPEEEQDLLTTIHKYTTGKETFNGTREQFINAYTAMQTHHYLVSATKYLTKAQRAGRKNPERREELLQQANYNYTRALNNIRGTPLEEKIKTFVETRFTTPLTDLEAATILPELDPDEKPSFANYADVSITESPHASDHLRKLGKKFRGTLPYALTAILAITSAFGIKKGVQALEHHTLITRNKEEARREPEHKIPGEENENWYWTPIGARGNHDAFPEEDYKYVLNAFPTITRQDLNVYLVAAPRMELDAIPHYVGTILPETIGLKQEYYNDTRQALFMIAKMMSDARAKGYSFEDQCVAARIGIEKLEEWKTSENCPCGDYYHYSTFGGFPEDVRMHATNAANTRTRR